MPRLRPDQNPAYRLHKPSGRAVVSIDGRTFYLGEHGSLESRQRYDELIGQWRLRQRTLIGDEPAHLALSRATAAAVEAAREIAQAPAAMTVADALALYWAHAQEKYGRRPGDPLTRQKNIARIQTALRCVNELHGLTPLTRFGPLALMAVREKMIRDDRSRRYINVLVRTIQRAFRWLVQREIIPPAIHQALASVEGIRRGDTDAREPADVKPVPDAFVDATIAAACPTVAAMIEVQRQTGMRSGELVIMRPVDIDMTGPVWEYRPARHKTEAHGHSRRIFIGRDAQAIIRPFLPADVNAYLWTPGRAVAEQTKAKRSARKTRVQPSQRDRRKAHRIRQQRARYATDTYGRAVKHAIDRAEKLAREAASKAGRKVKPDTRFVPPWHPHQLRHSFATRIRKLHGIEAARIMLGHASANMTEVYAERDDAVARDIVAKLGNAG